MLGSECVYFLYSFVEGLVFFLSFLLFSKFTFERLVVSYILWITSISWCSLQIVFFMSFNFLKNLKYLLIQTPFFHLMGREENCVYRMECFSTCKLKLCAQIIKVEWI